MHHQAVLQSSCNKRTMYVTIGYIICINDPVDLEHKQKKHHERGVFQKLTNLTFK